MSLQVYNTLTRRKEPFEPRQPGRVMIYICGPTVYDSTHIGHAMSYLVFDVIRRYLEFKGYQVRHVQNFTDIDDKIIQRAAQLSVSPEELADRHTREYLVAMAALNIKEADLYPRATAEVPTIIQMIEGLIEQGHAYVVDGNVFFKVTTFPRYGQLSRRSLAEMQAGEGVEASKLKTDPADFALWKAAKPGWLAH
jgi:cysteinyl-tRNA synthetase